MLNFSTKQARQSFESKNIPFMPGGIHENVVIKDIVVDKLQTGKYYIRFVYENPQGMTMQHTEFEPGKQPFQSDDDFQASVNNQINRIMNNQIIPYFGWKNGEYLPDTLEGKELEEALSEVLPHYDGSSYFGLINWVKEQIEEVSKATKLRIKVVYGKKGYTTLPNYSKYVSVEPMSAIKRRITELSIDQFTPIIVDDENKMEGHHKPVVDPLSTNTIMTPTYQEKTEDSDPLPF